MKYKKKNIVYMGLKKASSRINCILKQPRKILFTLLFIAITFFLLHKFHKVFFTMLLMITGIFSLYYVRILKYSRLIGFELIIMATVLTGIKYGPAYGAVTGAITVFLGMALNGNFKHSSFISVLTMPLVGIVAPLIANRPLPQIGLLMTLMYDIIILPLYIFMGSRIWKSALYFVTHLILNYWIFSTIAPFVIRFM